MQRFDNILKFEAQEMQPQEIKSMFADLIASGDIWQLPSEYVNIAAALIEQGLLTDQIRVLQ